MSRHISEVLANVLRQLQPKEDGGSGDASAMHDTRLMGCAPPSPSINEANEVNNGKRMV